MNALNASLTVPGKLFLLGEYIAIEGGPCVVALTKPGYRYTAKDNTKDGQDSVHVPIHPDSPVARLYPDTLSRSLYLLAGSHAPGLGSSTAEIIAVNRLFDFSHSLSEIWNKYKELFPRASGADLAAQWCGLNLGGACYLVSQFKEPVELNLPKGFLKRTFVFQVSPDQKLLTRHALPETPVKSGDAIKIVNDFTKAIQSSDIERAYQAMNHYADCMQGLGLVTKHAEAIREGFKALNAVAMVKGSGAGLHDLVLVGLKDGASPDLLADTAKRLGLRAHHNLESMLWGNP